MTPFPGGRLEIRCRKGIFHFMSLGVHDSVLPCDATSFLHNDNVYGNPSSLSDARLKTNLTEVTGEQCLTTLAQIQPQTYDREDLQERRLGLIADQCTDALEGLAIDNVVGERSWQVDGETDMYKTLSYDRLVPLLIGAVSTLSARVQQLEGKKRKTKTST